MSALEDALRYPMAHEDWIKTVLIGGVLSILGVLLIPLFLVYGYVVRAIRQSLAGEPEPPVFDDWEELLVDGIKAFVVVLVYMIVPTIVAAVTVGGSIIAIATGTRGGAAAGLAGLAFGLLLSFVLTLVFGYVAVAALVNFVEEDRLGAAFDVETLKSVVLESDYAVAWLLSVVVFLGAGVVTSVLNVVPLLGGLIGAFVVFYAQVVAANLWADGYSAARGSSETADQPGVEDSAI